MKANPPTADVRGVRWRGQAWCRALEVRRDLAYAAFVAAQVRLRAQEEAVRSVKRQHVREAEAALHADALCSRAAVLAYLADLHGQVLTAQVDVQRGASEVSQARDRCLLADRRLGCARKLQAAAAADHATRQQGRAAREADVLWLVGRRSR